MTHPMRKLIETITMDRTNDIIKTPPPVFKKPRGEGNEPTGGLYWMKGSLIVPITGTCNEIVSLPGQVVIVNPKKFGITSDEIFDVLSPFGNDKYAPVNEYEKFLEDPAIDLSHGAWLWKSSKVIYEHMLKSGWAWVLYSPPYQIQFAMIPSVVKRQLASASDHFSLLQIDKITITLLENFEGLSSKYPYMSKNKTLKFSKDEFKNFAGTFGGALDWSNGVSEAPAGNYLYLATTRPDGNLVSSMINVKVGDAYRKRYGIVFMTKPVEVAGKYTVRVSVSITNKIYSRNDSGVTITNSKGTRAVFSDRFFHIDHKDIEVLKDGKWVPVDGPSNDRF